MISKRAFVSRTLVSLILTIILLPFCAIAQEKNSVAGQTVAERLGYPADSRLLMIHADDFGMLHSVNRATEEALQNHWITSSSILVPCPWFPEAAAFAKTHPDADLGIHVALNSEWTTVRWRPVSPQRLDSSLLDKDGYLPLVEDEVVAKAKPKDVETEVRAQVEKAKAAGVNISHLDAHMETIIRTPELIGVYTRIGQSYNIPMLVATRPDPKAVQLPPAATLVDKVFGMSPGVSRSDWLKWYETTLAPLPPGVYQLTVHLGYDDDELRGATADHPDWGAEWRQNDFDMVRSPEFRQFLRDQRFIPVSWRDLSRALATQPSATSRR